MGQFHFVYWVAREDIILCFDKFLQLFCFLYLTETIKAKIPLSTIS